MIVRVKVDDRVFKVEIEDPQARPVVAWVEGSRFEILPEDGQESLLDRRPAEARQQVQARAAHPAPVTPLKPQSKTGGNGNGKAILAPIPGVVISVLVQAGAEVTTSQEIFVLEAMKMKNSIRASRPGKIASVNVAVGQHVKHQEILATLED